MSWVRDKMQRARQWLQSWCPPQPAPAGCQQVELETPSTDPLAKQFCYEVNKAARLLDFLIEEGRPFRIPDEIIDSIEAARSLVRESTPPSAADRARLLKAYRDLVGMPGTSVLYDFPPTRFWRGRSLWLIALVINAVILPILALLVMFVMHFMCERGALQSYWYWPVGYAVISVLTIWGLYVFTGAVTDHKLNQIIVFCYIFTGLILAASTLPWMIPMLFSGDIVGKAPVGILRGCVSAAGPDAATDMPEGVKCGDKGQNYQWVLNIGGVIEKRIPIPGAPKPSFVPEAVEVYAIRGGVVVPLYVLVLALVGGAVSMTRRVPEYQRRAMSAQDPFTNQEARESLVFQIMQVLSAPLIAITAYYIVNPTNLMSAVVLGFGSGFASEPILLMIRGLVEKLSPTPPPRATPVNAQAAPVIVRVDPPTKDLKPGESQQFTARVSGLASSEVTWLIVPSGAGSITQSGYYTAPADDGQTVTITACSVADRTKSGSATVTVKKAEQPPPNPAREGGG